FLLDFTKVVVHVQAQKGWDASLSNFVGLSYKDRGLVEMIPLTRPYGLQPGVAFQTQAFLDGKPLAGALVEIERYNPASPKELHPDEQITRAAKTDPNGIVTCTLTDPGWWCIAAHYDGEKINHNGKMSPLRKRAIIWVFVDEKVPSGADK